MSRSSRYNSGFSLLELLVVLVIAGIMLGAVSFNAMQSSRQRLQTDAQRIALLLQLAREEAIVRNRPIAFEADQNRYHFLVRNDLTWEPILDVDMLREREFAMSPVQLAIDPVSLASTTDLRIVFGREPVDKPFVLSMIVGEDKIVIRADGIGHFVVE
ncbi:GspH/FimT family pseudopilin [Undibacterium sp. RTI2.1]|uniref:GspH/FimT family pseudopilin n=1 Tax=unclassified Undibacterium TaxID=2630295 RepID=UPI002AB43F81|nr:MULTISPECIES: GspH/FimT family pseudopilin [unclassified Undibacterium]MDY7538065.1 GspH/FimT family pseudopilin [Undibacterium sp. 5I1]MEB0032532.1 GspH/FimT family pseudopilin [Undibacterium sp. RTI2.1]MEB0117871.1 GspH/FimT family pseudopilin [Undibacterium sp. RTI2.2]MEB0231648.1 GspH/FimT family pseudopilin [Undibacterium sp. 10I3]MEB0258659.1 GspH/FimT family pseudopilin [Undibacterium sp. 5I1]